MNKTIRYSLIAFLLLMLIAAGFARETKLLVFRDGFIHLINRYPKAPTTSYFSMSPKLQSSILFSLLFTSLSAGILYLLTQSSRIATATVIIYLSFMALCFVLLKLGSAGVDYRLSTGLSHYLEDLFLSPFLILATIVLFQFTGLIKKS